MDKLEMVERLRERTNVSYAEAMDALNMSDWDLLDAIVLLERQGKTQGPEKEQYSTSYDQQEGYQDVQAQVRVIEGRSSYNNPSFRGFVREVMAFLRSNYFSVTRKGRSIFTVRAWILVLILFIAWKQVVPVMVVAMLFGIRYSIFRED